MQKGPGYKLITPIQLCNAISAYNSGAISFFSLRTYFACFELEAIREAAKRSQRAREKPAAKSVYYRNEELKKLLGINENRVGEEQIKRSLIELEKANLLIFTSSKITFTETPLPEARELLAKASENRNPTRSLPIPRHALKFIARSHKPALVTTFIAYLIRSLSLNKTTGKIKSAGTIKASWIAGIFGLSERAVKDSRAQLIKLGWITKDTGSRQRKLNRDGSYFVINVYWGRTKKEQTKNEKPSEVIVGIKQGELRQNPLPLSPPVRTNFAPPLIRLKTFNKSKNQYKGGGVAQSAQKQAPTPPSGFYKKEIKKQPPKSSLSTPTIRDIKLEDLKRVTTLMVLYEQAIRARWLEPSEANLVNFVAAAVRATRAKWGEPVRIFVSIVKKKLWHHITNEQEDRAIAVIKRYRGQQRLSLEQEAKQSSHENEHQNVTSLLHSILSSRSIPRTTRINPQTKTYSVNERRNYLCAQIKQAA